MNAKIVKANSIAHKMNRQGRTGDEVLNNLNSQEDFEDHHFIIANKAIFMVHDNTEQRQFVCNIN